MKVHYLYDGIQHTVWAATCRLFLTASTSQYWNIGLPSHTCNHCHATMRFEERSEKRYINTVTPKFHICCAHGRVALPLYKQPPKTLYDLYHNVDKRSRYFQKKIRFFNTMFALTSMGGKIERQMNVGGGPPIFVMNGDNYHQIGSLLPMPGGQPKFAQLYVYDTENEVHNRMSVVG